MPKTSSERLVYIRNWQKRNPEKVKEYERTRRQRRKNSGFYQREEYLSKNRERMYKRRRTPKGKIEEKKTTGKYATSKKELINELFGRECFICTYAKRLVTHKKDGLPHKLISDMGKAEILDLFNKHREEYVRVCFKCHKRVHWCMEYLGLSWDIIERLLRENRTIR